MTPLKTTLYATAALLATGSAGYACPVTSGNISILSNDFAAIHAINGGAEACVSGDATFSANQTTEHRDIQVAALTANPAQYTSAVVASSSIVPLLNNDLIRPLDDLIAEHAPDLPAINKVVIDGQVMAIAFMANAQHLFVRQDILEQAGVDMPTSYEEVVAAAQAIKDAGIMEHPFAKNTKTGWNLGEEFVNMYLGLGGEFFEAGTAAPAINNETGIAALEMMKALADLSNPDFLTFDSNATAALWESGEVAIAQMWGSRAAPILDDEGSTPEIVANTVLAAAPTVGGGTTPASTLWWDGFTIAKNVSDADAEATFIAMMNGLTDEVITANNDATIWLHPAYVPAATAEGVSATAAAGATPYPMVPYMSLMHTALGAELSDFLQGQESAAQALADVEAAYTEAATEQGFLQ